MADLGADAFDFWLGTWDVAFEGGSGVNTITRRFGGHVIHEEFELTEPRPFNGTSVSVFRADTGLWQQTWVDDQGSYWHFVGTTVDGDPAFETPTPVDGHQLYKRMVFSDIAPDSLAWRWESSPDRHVWTQNWAVAYERRS